MLALLFGNLDVLGCTRKHGRNVGFPLADSRTLYRLESGVLGQVTQHRYKKILGILSVMDRLLAEIFL